MRSGIEERLGAPVLGWTSHDGGYSPGLASTLHTADGPVFVKAVSPDHEESQRLYRREAERAAALPDTVLAPRFRWLLDIPGAGGAAPDTWVAVAFDAVPGRPPRTDPWDAVELAAVQTLARRIAEHEPAPDGPFPGFGDHEGRTDLAQLADERPAGLATYDPWFAAVLDRLVAIAEDWVEATAGPHLVHNDLRGDNALILPGRRGEAAPSGSGLTAVAVDWPYASRGAAYLDQVSMLPAVQTEGGPPPEVVLRRHPLPPGTDEDAVTCRIATMTGYFVRASLDDPPPAIPHVRAFQRAQAEVCIPWLRKRLAARRG